MSARILIINDSRTILAWYQRFLEAEGYRVYTDTAVPQEMSMIEHATPDLMIFDVLVSNINDLLHLIHSLKLNQTTASIPILICTIWQHEISRRAHDFSGQGVEVLYKPFSIQELVALVKQMLQSRNE